MKKFLAGAVLVVASVAAHAATDVVTVRPLYIALKRASDNATTAALKWDNTLKTKGSEAGHDDYVAFLNAQNVELHTVQRVINVVADSDNATKQAFRGLLMSVLLALDADKQCAGKCKSGSPDYDALSEAMEQLHRETVRTLRSLESEHPELASE